MGEFIRVHQQSPGDDAVENDQQEHGSEEEDDVTTDDVGDGPLAVDGNNTVGAFTAVHVWEVTILDDPQKRSGRLIYINIHKGRLFSKVIPHYCMRPQPQM